jgi:hypothetical protein
MKKCPFCAEEIQDDALKCRFCNEFLKKKEKEKWYFKPFGMLCAFFCVGPFALPLVWFNPSLDKTKKIIITVIVLGLSVYLTIVTIKSLQSIFKYYNLIFQ